MSRPTDRFGIGSLAPYDELLSPMVAQAQLLGTADYLAGVNARQRQAQQSIQQPTAAQSLMPQAPTLEDEFKQRRATYAGILGDPAEQRNMTQAQMLFDIANTALAFSTAGSRPGMSPAERLAEAAVETKLFPTISARTQAATEQQQKFDLAALQSAETSLLAKQKAAADYAKTVAGQDPEYMRVRFDDGTEKVYNVNSAMGSRAFQNAAGQPGAKAFKVGAETASTAKTPDYMSVFNADGSPVGVYNVNDPTELSAFNTARDRVLPLGGTVGKTGTVEAPEAITDQDYFTKFGMSKSQFEALPVPDQNFLRGLPVITNEDFFKKFGMTQDQFNALGAEDKRVLQGLPTLTDENYFQKFGMGKAEFLALDPDVRNRLTGVAPEPEIRSIDGQLVDVTNPEAPKVIFGEAARPTPKLITITLDGTPATVDVNTEEGQSLMERANAANAEQPGRATFNTVSSPPPPRGFLIDGKIRMSYDNGRTYTVDGQAKTVPDNAFEVSNTTSYDVFKNETAKAKAAAQLRELQQARALMLTRPDGTTVSPEEAGIVTDAFNATIDATGPYAAFQAGVDQLIGGFVPAFRELFQDTQANRQYIRALKILGSSALSVSPRLAVFDLARVERLFPDPDAFFRNPQSEANKLVVLKRTALNQKARILEEQQAGISDTGLKAQLNQKLYEIDRLLDMLGSVDIAGGAGVSPAQLDALRQSIMR